ncbi:major abundant protein BTP1 [Sarcoptes scabiei]|nr:major abundant protein BTP1 [Sarcoptes scabiei]
MNTKFEIEKSRLRSPSLSPSSTLSYWWNESDKMMILNDGDESKSNPFRETKRSNTDHNDGDLNHLDRDRKTNEIDLQQYVDFIHNLQQRQQQSQTNLLSTSRFDRKSFINIERIDEEDGPNVTRTMIQTDLYRHRNHLENDNSSGDDKDEIISTNLDNQIQMRIDELNPTTESHSNGSTMIENLVQSNQSKDFDNDLDTVVDIRSLSLWYHLSANASTIGFVFTCHP